MAYHKFTTKTGFSLIEVLIVAGIMAVFFTGLFGSFRYSLALIADSKAKLTALTVANDEIEFIRSLTYNAVGTVAGIPAGTIPQVSTTTLNGIEFTKRILIEYIDDPADGTGSSDSNGIITDYKQAKVTVSWNSKGTSREIFLVTNIIPRSIETSVGGGTIRVNVFNDSVIPLPAASVRVVNKTVIPNIDVTRSADAKGVALFSGAPAGVNYEVYVTAPGYSSSQTYFATTTMPNPINLPATVVEANDTTLNFFIDVLSTLNLRTLGSVILGSSTASFSDLTELDSSNNISANSGQLILTDLGGGVYASVGEAMLLPITPSPLSAWSNISLVATESASTSVLVHFYTSTSTSSLIPDSDLPGNSAGFSGPIISLEGLSPATYSSIYIGLNLTTIDTSVTPSVDELVVNYRESESIIANVPLKLVGDEAIGTDASTSPVYKNIFNISTDGSGEYQLANIESEAYIVTTTGYDIAEACPANPVVVSPGSTINLDLLLTTNSANSFRVVTKTTTGTPIVGAKVILSRPGFNATALSSDCGQVYFGGLASAADYDLLIEVTGYADNHQTGLSISGDKTIGVQF